MFQNCTKKQFNKHLENRAETFTNAAAHLQVLMVSLGYFKLASFSTSELQGAEPTLQRFRVERSLELFTSPTSNGGMQYIDETCNDFRKHMLHLTNFVVVMFVNM